MQAVACCLLAVLLLAPSAYGQAVNPKKGQPLLIKPGQVAKLTWKPAPPHPDVVMCCGGALQLSWSPMDSGVVASVVLNVDNSCPNSLRNQEYVKYLFQAQPKGLVTLDFKQNGDYYISCAVAEHCNDQGMQFLLAVRGCSQDNSIYTPVIPLNVQCNQMAAGGRGMGGAGAGGMGTGSALGSASGLAGLTDAPQAPAKRKNSAGAAPGSVLAAAAAALAGVAAAALL